MFGFPLHPVTNINKSWKGAAFGAAAVALMTVGAAPQAEAASMVMYSGDTTGGPTWNRPDQGVPPSGLASIETNVPYSVQEFSVDTNGFYTLFSESTTIIAGLFFYNNFLVFYETSFDPTNPLINVIASASDDINSGFVFLPLQLTAGTSYFLVTTGFDNGDFGTFTNTITGPQGSHITLGSTPTPVPVPPAALGLLLTSVLSARKLLQHKQTVGVQRTAKV
ncbi:MAG: hypothetical protein IGQ88_09850 [Gloeomargaritaceae cyanobacterium C42_A2020_066]|nr:hypothetical protein [Gloeomargaritaceae cyanobacterium C42_A2020_066]